MGLTEDWDFALHLPIRYEDETRITRLRDALPGVACQVEADIIHNEITYRPRRQLVVQAKDGEDLLTLRFLNFYGSQIKQLAVGKHLRLFGEVRPGFFWGGDGASALSRRDCGRFCARVINAGVFDHGRRNAIGDSSGD